MVTPGGPMLRSEPGDPGHQRWTGASARVQEQSGRRGVFHQRTRSDPREERMFAIDQQSYDTLVAHARAEYPNEACALLSGRDHTVAKVYALPNAEASPTFYVVDPKAPPAATDDVGTGWSPALSATARSDPIDANGSNRRRRLPPGGSIAPMAVEVRIPTILRKYSDGAKSVEAEGSTVRDLFSDLEARFPGISGQLLTPDGGLHRFVNVYVNDEDIRFLGALDAKLDDGDVVAILPAVAGGAARRMPEGR